ncbi:YugN family protein [Virgibacillus sp. C22-A2]|uniref:YugN family protein n=1 Tax=Virgibacillus tibetensis TaxID=3042313 RepID=A0ABU6KHW0_9BACI|nr:YugN family protein [Virgibacillus sp. C22-A2]
MVPLDSKIEQKIYSLYVLEELLKPEGFVIGSNWDYDNGHFDLKIDDKGIYYYLRIPFYAVAGSLDYPGVTVRLEKPFLLAHQYQGENDVEGPMPGTAGSLINQFQTPIDPDADVPDEYIAIGKELVQKIESLILPID